MMNYSRTNVIFSSESVFDTEDALFVDESEVNSLIRLRMEQLFLMNEVEAVSASDTEDDSVSDSDSYSDIESSEILQEILIEVQVTNRMIGINIALEIFILALFFFCFVMRILKNNVTNMI